MYGEHGGSAGFVRAGLGVQVYIIGSWFGWGNVISLGLMRTSEGFGQACKLLSFDDKNHVDLGIFFFLSFLEPEDECRKSLSGLCHVEVRKGDSAPSGGGCVIHGFRLTIVHHGWLSVAADRRR